MREIVVIGGTGRIGSKVQLDVTGRTESPEARK